MKDLESGKTSPRISPKDKAPLGSLYRWLIEQSEEVIAYAIGIFLMAATVVGHILYQLMGRSTGPEMYLIAILFLLYGFANFTLEVFRRTADTTAAKGVYALVVALLAPFALSCASIAVNYALEVPSEAFPATVLYVAVLIAPLLVLAGVAVLGFILSPLIFGLFMEGAKTLTLKGLLTMRWPQARRQNSVDNILLAGRVVSFFALLTMIMMTLNYTGPYLNKVVDLAKWYAYTFETQKYSHCSTAPDEFVASVMEDRIVRAKKNGDSYSFIMGPCTYPSE